MTAPTITEFLLARITEDGAGALDALEDTWDPVESKDAWWAYEWSTPAGPNAWPTVEAHVRRFRPTRVLAECEAKRAIVAEHEMRPDATGAVNCISCEEWCRYEPCPTLRILAAVYADHPDYQQEWAVSDR